MIEGYSEAERKELQTAITRFGDVLVYVDCQAELFLATHERRRSLVPADEVLRTGALTFTGPYSEAAQATVDGEVKVAAHSVWQPDAPSTPEQDADRREHDEMLNAFFGDESAGMLRSYISALVTKLATGAKSGPGDRSAPAGRDPISWAGVWDAKGTYSRSATVTFQGTLWHCEKDGTTDKPGQSGAWRLMVKNHPNQQSRHAS